MNKRQLREQEIRTRYITPAIQADGWKPQKIRGEDTLSAGMDQASECADQGIDTIKEAHTEAPAVEVLQLPLINQIGRPVQILYNFGSKIKFLQAVRELEQEIYRAA